MKAVVITRHGGAEVLEIRDVGPAPSPPAGSVRVRVRAAGLNRADILQRQGRYPAPPGYSQDIPGLEFAGEVDEVGSDDNNWRPGQRVFGITAGGAQAEFIVIPSEHLVEVPDNLDWVNAAAVPEVFITAHDALFTCARLKAGETMLVHAAGSGVGIAAIQLAQANGATAFGTSRTAEKLEQAKAYGLSNAQVISDEPKVLIAAVDKWTAGGGIDVLLDLVGASYLEANLGVLASKGRMVLIGTTSGSHANLDFSTVMRKRLTIIGTVLRARSREEKTEATRLFAEQVVPLLAAGIIRPVVDRVYKFTEVQEAHRRMEANENFGKIVVVLD